MAATKQSLQITNGNGQFSNNLYQVLAKNPGNLFFSPIGVHAVLSMAWQGAQGKTSTAFASTLKVRDHKVAAQGYKDIINTLNNVKNITLLMANKVYLKDGYELLPEFNNAVTENFASDVQLLDFGQKQAVAKTINSWVEQKTRDKIKDLIKPDDLDALSTLVLVNAIYFKGYWEHQFNKHLTRKQPFYLNDKDTIDVDMMNIKRSFNYKIKKSLDAQILELPYRNKKFSMIVILPNKKNGIKDLETKLAKVDLSKITKGLHDVKVIVALPKFKFEQTIDMEDSLTKRHTIAATRQSLQVASGNGQFSNNLYKILAKSPGNVFFSPISVHAVLSMAWQGAQGTTSTAFASTLKVQDNKVAAEGYKDIINTLNNVENMTLLMANKIYLKDGHELLPEFNTAVTKEFDSEVQLLDFGQQQAAVKTINSWVEQQTRHKIKNIIEPSNLNAFPRFVLVNAIYFKGNWQNQINKELTRKQPFYLNKKDSVDVDMMHIKEHFNYKNRKSLDAQILELPYRNQKFSLIVILPNKKNDIKNLEKKLANVDLSKITEDLHNVEVNVALPKFKFEQTIDMNDSLTKLGLGEIFDKNKANFKGMIPLRPDENLYVSKVIQNSFIEVNEEGTEAAAATALLSFLVITLLSAAAMAASEQSLQVANGNGQFSNNLYKVLAEKPGNVFFSPISAHAVLSMAWQGAQGTTSTAFASTLKVTDNKVAAQGYKDIINTLNHVENITLLMANRVYLKDGYELLPEFHNAVTKDFASDVQLVDFGQSQAAAKTINAWVEEQTRDKIKDLIKPDDLDALTRLVLVNAIYFKGNWQHQFNKQLTRKQPFYLNEKDSVDVDMMHIKEHFNYKNDEELNAQILELPYQNQEFSMVVILPNERNGIKDLETKLENVDLSNITEGLHNIEVNVALPKFKFEQTIDMKESLTKLGLGEIFDQNKANFKGMIPLRPDENLYVSKVIQKAFIEVNEEGAEAAAATGAVFRMKRSLIISEEFIADHPFIFLITSRKRKEARNNLFMGKLIYHPIREEVHDEL